MPHGQKAKTYNRSNIVTNLIKALKMVHVKKRTANMPSYVTHLISTANPRGRYYYPAFLTDEKTEDLSKSRLVVGDQ